MNDPDPLAVLLGAVQDLDAIEQRHPTAATGRLRRALALAQSYYWQVATAPAKDQALCMAEGCNEPRLPRRRTGRPPRYCQEHAWAARRSAKVPRK